MKKLYYSSNLTLIIFFLLAICSHINSNTICSSLMEVTSETSLSASPENKKILGKMMIEGSTYSAICDCSPITLNKDQQTGNLGPKCDPAKLKIMSEKEGLGSSIDDIRILIGNIQDLNYINVENSEFSCLDGRSSRSVLASPGGDTGEFILALMVYEDLIGGGRRLSQDNIDLFFTQYLKVMKPNKFIMCTDDNSLSHIEKDLLVNYYFNILNKFKIRLRD